LLKEAGKFLIVFALAALVSLGIFEGVSERRISYYYLGKGGWGGSAWVDLGNRSAFITTTSWFNPPEVEGVTYELECEVYIGIIRVVPSPTPPNATRIGLQANITVYEMKVYVMNKSAAAGLPWSMLLSSKLPEATKILEKYSEIYADFEEETQLKYAPPTIRFFKARVPLKTSREERIAIFIMISNATTGSFEPDVNSELIMKIKPGFQQYARAAYLFLAGISLIVLYYLRNPNEAKELSERIRRRFPLLFGSSTREKH